LSLSTVIASDIEHAQLMNAVKLRDLDAFEELFWLLEQSVSVSHAVIAEVSGRTTIHQWKDALDAMQIRYPLLSASIRKVPGERPYFERVRGTSMALGVAPLNDSLVLEEEMEKELQRSFGDGRRGPLTRATLFHSPDRSVVMFASHHSGMDGMSHLLLLQDLLAAVRGEGVGKPLALQPGLGQLLGLPAPVQYGKKLEGRSVAPEDGALEMPDIRIQRMQLGVEETDRLRRRAKEEGTTVHAALIAALTLAGKGCSERWKVGPVRCLSPIDMRKSLGIPTAPGLLISSHVAPVETPEGESLWDIARTIRGEMLPAQSVARAQDLLAAMSSVVAEEQNARDLYWSVVNSPLAHELLVANYAGYKVRGEYGALKIENLFTGSPAMVPALQKVSVLTVNGRLGMTLVAREPFPSLLEDACEILTRA
jgi:hypothetical protein